MGFIERLRNDRSVAVPAAVGAVAIVLAVVVILWSSRGNETGATTTSNEAPTTSEATPKATPTTATKAPPAQITSKAFTYRKGGYRLDAPTDLVARNKGRTTRFTAKDKSVVITVGQSLAGRLAPTQKRFLSTLSKSYGKVKVIKAENLKIDGKPARATYGRATNSKGGDISFVTFMVRDRPRNFAITAYTAAGSDPATVLPRVNRVVNSFEVLPAKK